MAHLARISNLSMRLVTMASNFALTFVIARYVAPADLGLYGLVAATITAMLYLVGLDFYTFSTRELIRSDRRAWGRLIKSHASLMAVLYVLALPILLSLFAFRLLPWWVAPWFVVLLVVEHVSREVSRILIASSRQLLASCMMLVRKGLWAWVLMALMYLAPETRHLSWILGSWLVAALAACCVGAVAIRRMDLGGWDDRVDWNWLRRGVKVSTTLLVGTFALQCLSTVDRYAIQYLMGREALGAYVLFASLSVAMSSVLDAGVFSFAYPKLVEAQHRGRQDLVARELKTMVLLVSAVCAVISLVLLLAYDQLLAWLGNDVYVRHKDMLPWVLGASTMACLAYVPHYGLYARRQDQAIVMASLGALLLFPVFVFLLSSRWPTLSVPMAMCGAQAAHLLLKTMAFLRPVALPAHR